MPLTPYPLHRPIHGIQRWHSPEVALVSCYNGQTVFQGDCGNAQIHEPDVEVQRTQLVEAYDCCFGEGEYLITAPEGKHAIDETVVPVRQLRRRSQARKSP